MLQARRGGVGLRDPGAPQPPARPGSSALRRPSVLARPSRSGPVSTSREENGAGAGWQVVKYFGGAPDAGGWEARRTLAAPPAVRSRGERSCRRLPTSARRPRGPCFVSWWFLCAEVLSGAVKSWGGLHL